MKITLFADVRAAIKHERRLTLDELFDFLATPPTAKLKEHLPLLKLSTFGDKRSACGSLRHNDNIKESWGIECDYDGSEVSFHQALESIRATGIGCVGYTTPSSTPDAPRWRLLFPFRKAHDGYQVDYVDLVDGFLGNILAPESYSPSQSYFYGKITTDNDYECEVIHGDKFLDDVPVHPMVSTRSDRVPGAFEDSFREPQDWQELEQALWHIDPDCDYPEWAKVGNILKSIPNDAGRKLFESWSGAGLKHNPATDNNKWDQLDGSKTNYRSLFKVAASHGWVNPRGRVQPTMPVAASCAPGSKAIGGMGIQDGNDDIYPLSAIGTKLRVIEKHGENLRFLIDSEEWIHWGGSRWNVSDQDGSCLEYLNDIIWDICTKEVDSASYYADKEAIIKWGRKLQSHGVMIDVIKQIKADPRIHTHRSEFDIDTDTIAFDECRQIACLRTGESRLATREDKYSLSVKCQNIGTSDQAVRWCQFIDEIFVSDLEIIHWMQKFLGYCLTGRVDSEIFAFFYGSGCNGKSVLIKIMTELLGSYAGAMNVDAITRAAGLNQEANKTFAKLAGKRFVALSEIDEYVRIDEAKIKQIVAGDTITARHLFKSEFDYKPKFKLILSGNDRPTFYDRSAGLWRRLRMIDFDADFTDREDRELYIKLMSESEHIFAWLIDGAILYYKEGLRDVPTSMVLAAEEHRQDCTMTDVFSEFAANNLIASTKPALFSTIYEEYLRRCEFSGEKRSILTRIAFGKRLRKLKFKTEKKNGNMYVFAQFGVGSEL